MRQRPCPHEADVLALVTIDQWPRQADSELIRHVNGCDSCAEVVMVAAALAELDAGTVTPTLPDARAVWHRAQWQARRDAITQAAQPVLAVQAAAAGGAAVVLAFLAGWLAASGALAGWAAGLSGALSNAAGWLDGPLGGVTDAAGVPAMVWIAGAAVAFGATTVLVALAVSALADLPSQRRERA